MRLGWVRRCLSVGGFCLFRLTWPVVGAAWQMRSRGARRREGEMTAPAIELIDVHKNFGATKIIRGVSLPVPAGERHAIIGPNGAGKSTLFNLISGRLTPTSGDGRLNGEDVTGLPPHQINRRGLSRSFQVTNIFPRLSVWENVRCAVLWSLGYRYAFWRGIDGLADVRERTESILRAIDLIDRRRVPAGVLTYAEQRALEIGDHHRGRRRHHPARRAERRDERRRGGARGRADPQASARAAP